MNLDQCVSIELTDHQQYLWLLEQLRKNTAYIMLIQINEEDEKDPILSEALSCMKLAGKRYVSKWPGTVRKGAKAPQYLFRADARFFKFLNGFPSFFFNRKDPWGCELVEETDFGQDDIAFLDQEQNILFYTTTHEGYAYGQLFLAKA